MKTLFLIFLAMSGPVATAQDGRTALLYAGCYELKVEGHLSRIYGEEDLPKRFELTSKPAREDFVAKNLDFDSACGFAKFLLERKGERESRNRLEHRVSWMEG